MHALWPPGPGPSVQDGGDSTKAVGETAQDPGPLLTGPDTALWVGFGAFVVIFLFVLMLVIRGRVIGPARRKALAEEPFFEPAGEGAEISFDEPETAVEERTGGKNRKAEKDRKKLKSAAPDVSEAQDARERRQSQAASEKEAPRENTPVLKARRPGSPFAGLFKKKAAMERPQAEPVERDEGFAEVSIAPAAAQDDAHEERHDEREEEDYFTREDFADRRAAEDDKRRRAERERAEAERARLADEEQEQERLRHEARERAAREAEFERRKSEAALEQRLQSLSSMERRLTERTEALNEEEEAAQSRLNATLEARFERLADRLNAKIDGLAANGPGRANDDHPGYSKKTVAEFADRMSRELSALRKSTEDAIAALSRRIDAADAASPAGAAGLTQEIAKLNTLLAGKTAASTAGRIQLNDLVRSVLPAERYAFSKQLSTGRTADCLIYAPNIAAPFAIDARFPVEAFDQYVRARVNPDHEARARDEYRRTVLRHVVDIAERLIAPGETADFAVMFAPSESIFSDLHAEFGDIVQDSYRARVWIVSPTSLMASLHMMTALAGGAPQRRGAEYALREEIDALWARVAALEDDLARGYDAPAEDTPPEGDDRPFSDEYEPAHRRDRGDLNLTPEEDAFERIEREHASRPPFPLRSQEQD